jgi:hypothetical protein
MHARLPKSASAIHHIDGNPANNGITNLAALCLDHHDMASMQLGLTKKLKPNQVRTYKKRWEAECAADMKALTRDRENFFVTLYKNPPRIREQFVRLSDETRRKAVIDLARAISGDEKAKSKEGGFKFQLLPGRGAETASWRGVSQAGVAKGKPDRGRSPDAGPRSDDDFDSAEIRGLAGGRVYQGQECDPFGPYMRGEEICGVDRPPSGGQQM